MGLLRKWTFLILFSVFILSCNVFVAVIDEYITNPQETKIPEEEEISTPIPTETQTPDPSDTPTPTPSSMPYEILYNSGSGSGWFGGDDGTPRNVGIGQGVYIDSNIMITDFSFYFTTKFDYTYSPDGFGHAVTIRYTLRDNTGNPVLVQDVNVPDTFTNGWITWSSINRPAYAGETWIFTAYLLDGYNNMYSSSAAGDTSAGYTSGVRYTKSGTTDASMDSWAGWGTHSWDSWFWLQGYTQ